ncbi:hypothetical protein EGK75_10345 [Neisseria weixii]|uniref:Uncharacterized protein n=1 Tax=Neisseria weixii TaxID=1853276 RepID=A0A3N4MNR5_9NEIS|nr:hypothetical protein [Neisseria weixii]RPD84848.1 hypothetical protein EGK74_10475 [Neisseria weixii]RPD85682.1 hypothetical protein EGK75_10345 [Neisseria weixii]
MSETCCPYCDYVCGDETHKAATAINGVGYEVISSEPAWIPAAAEWGQNVELSPIVVTGARPSGGVNHALVDDSLPIVIDNAPYTDMVGSAYFEPRRKRKCRLFTKCR